MFPEIHGWDSDLKAAVLEVTAKAAAAGINKTHSQEGQHLGLKEKVDAIPIRKVGKPTGYLMAESCIQLDAIVQIEGFLEVSIM